MQNVLPPTSFVAFSTWRLARPTVAWTNEELSSPRELVDHAYCLPLAGDPPDAFVESSSRTQYGERYGGDGLGHNGGGVRCGLIGTIQIKGVGQNPLVGRHADFWHHYGGARLEEAVREAVWGEICNAVLPCGGVRVLGIVLTGTHVTYQDASSNERKTKRALVFRQPALRPAHYLRAIDYQPIDTMANEASDVTRTINAVQQIDAGFRRAFGSPGTKAGDDYVLEALFEMADRFASQLAASRAKRVVHNLLNGSNICLDGRWIDFCRTSTTSDYGKVIMTRGMPAMLSQHVMLHSTLQDLCFYIAKYRLKPSALPARLPERVLERYLATLSIRLELEFLKLTGIPEHELKRIDPAMLTRLSRAMKSIVSEGDFEPFKLDSSRGQTMPSRMGTFHLNTVLRMAASCSAPSDMSEALQGELSNDGLRDRFVSAYWDVRCAYLNAPHVTCRDNAAVSLAIDSIRQNIDVEELYLPTLDAAIDGLVQNSDGEERIAAFIQDTVQKAKAVLCDASSEVSLCALFRRGSRRELGIFSNTTPNTQIQAAIEAIDERVLPPTEKLRVIKQCSRQAS